MILNDVISPIVSIAPVVAQTEVDDEQMALYADLIYRRTGIRGFDEYYEHLTRLRADDPEWDQFLQEITTHETFLFRDANHWEWFRGTYLPQCAAEARAGIRPCALRIWSAACSTGDQAFTAACCIAAGLPNFQQWQFRIVGTDIGIGAVTQAKAARFSERAIRLVPQAYKERFFSKDLHGNSWQARPVLTGMVAFRQHNLLDPPREQPFDLVFLKNVLIYFAPASKQRVVENVRSLIRPGGLLVAGAAEGIGDLLKDYVRLQPWLYQRPKK